jgi:hypothetical protein
MSLINSPARSVISAILKARDTRPSKIGMCANEIQRATGMGEGYLAGVLAIMLKQGMLTSAVTDDAPGRPQRRVYYLAKGRGKESA